MVFCVVECEVDDLCCLLGYCFNDVFWVKCGYWC